MNKNVIVGQSGGPTAVINCSLAGVFLSALGNPKMDKIFGMRNGVKGLLEKRYINMGDYVKNQADLDLLKVTPSSFLGSCRYKLPSPTGSDEDRATFAQIFEILNELEIGYFFYIGGNDSMDTIMKLSTYGEEINSPIRFIGVPKTIDNDLAGTDHSPGFGSAAKYVATSTKEIILDAQVYNNGAVTIIEAMGRNTGWLAAAASLAKGDDCAGVDAIYLPEVAFDMDNFLDKISKLTQNNYSPVVVVSEGIKLADGRYISELGRENVSVDAFGHMQLTGTASYLAAQVKSKTGSKARAIEFATLQRCAAHLQSATDAKEAFELGFKAVNAASEGQTNVVVTIDRLSNNPYSFQISTTQIATMANVEKTVPLEWVVPAKDHVTDDYIKYALPLIQGESKTFIENGLPKHLKI